MRRLHGLAGGALVCSMVVAIVAAGRADAVDSSPISPPAAWHWAWVLGAAAAFALYGVGAWCVRRSGTLRLAVAVALAVQLLPLAAPLMLSRDVYLYWAEARVVTVHHANPYVTTPSQFPDDPATQQASAQWRDEPEPYGPGWVALGAVPAAVAGSSAETVRWAYRLLAVAGVVAVLALLARRTRSAAAVTFFGWNPLLAFHLAGGGHTDVWIALALVVGVAYRGRAAGGAAWSLGTAFKVVPAILLPLELAQRRVRWPRRAWAGLVLAGLAVVVLATAFFGLHWVSGVSAGAHLTSPVGGVHVLSELGLRHRYAVALAALVFALVYAVLLRRAWRTGSAQLSLAATALCLCSSLLRPWYAAWPVALAAVEEDNGGQLAAYLLTGYLLFADAIPY